MLVLALATFTTGEQLCEEENTIVSAPDKHVLAEAAALSFLFWRKMQLHSLPSVTLLLLEAGVQLSVRRDSRFNLA